MLKNSVSLFIFLLATTTIPSLISISSFSSSLVSASSSSSASASSSATSTGTSLRPQLLGNITAIDTGGRTNNDVLSSTSCYSLTACKNCTSFHTCHWCEKSESCHARGSIHGCAWGSSCSKPTPKKENDTCSAQTTCSNCSLSSRFCHWCEHDNACHAVGSRFGCAVGVDCYSNDRCRRSEAEPLPVPSSPIQAIMAALNRVPTMGLTVIAFLFIVSFGCMTCCFCFVTNIKGAYNDLAEITIAASVAPMSVIGDAQYFTALADLPDEEEAVLTEEGNASNTTTNNNNADTNIDNAIDNDNGNDNNGNDNDNNSGENTDDGGDAPIEQPLQPSQPEPQNDTNSNNQQQQQPTEDRNNPYFLMDGTRNNNANRYHLLNRGSEVGPLLHPTFNGYTSFDGTATGYEEPIHMKRLHRLCSTVYYLSVLTLVLVVGASVFFFPQEPVYNVCNDEVAWMEIMKHIVAFKLDASFEILASLSNPNRVAAALDRGKGSFTFEGKQFGTFEIPPITIDPMTITDFMIIVHLSPADKIQAIQLVEAYYMGKLILDAEFEGTVRVPALFGYSQGINVNDIVVDINKASDRSLCQCPTWDDGKNHSIASLPQFTSLPQFMESESLFVSLES